MYIMSNRANTSKDIIEEDCSSQEQFEAQLFDDLFDEEIESRGVDITEIKKCKRLCPDINPSDQHVILFKLPRVENKRLRPYPNYVKDVWDNDNVRMPHSNKNLFPVSSTELKLRWSIIKHSLSRPISSSDELEAAILNYNSRKTYKFQALHKFFQEILTEEETDYVFDAIIPNMIKAVLSLPTLITSNIPLMKIGQNKSISLSQEQIACLLANAFFCTFPNRNSVTSTTTFPTINFSRLFQCGDLSSTQEKLKCLLNYFKRVYLTDSPLNGVVTYTRYFISPLALPIWKSSKKLFKKLHITSKGTIEDDGTGYIEIDFANKIIGGGVLGRGSVQEEIKFLICPELILSRLFTESLSDSEALIITGFERFNSYVGYGSTFQWSSNYNDLTPKDEYGRRLSVTVAIDATRFTHIKKQFEIQYLRRELNKAYVGFSYGLREKWKINIATGNWGCGAFGGDAKLKALLQLMAAAEAERDLLYFTFQDRKLRDEIYSMYTFLIENNVNVGQLWEVLVDYGMKLNDNWNCDFYKYITHTLTKTQEKECQNVSVAENNNSSTAPKSNIEINDTITFAETQIPKKDPISIETYKINNEDGRQRCIAMDRRSWQGYNSAKKTFTTMENNLQSKETSCITSATTSTKTIPKKFKITDYFDKKK